MFRFLRWLLVGKRITHTVNTRSEIAGGYSPLFSQHIQYCKAGEKMDGYPTWFACKQRYFNKHIKKSKTTKNQGLQDQPYNISRYNVSDTNISETNFNCR